MASINRSVSGCNMRLVELGKSSINLECFMGFNVAFKMISTNWESTCLCRCIWLVMENPNLWPWHIIFILHSKWGPFFFWHDMMRWCDLMWLQVQSDPWPRITWRGHNNWCQVELLIVGGRSQCESDCLGVKCALPGDLGPGKIAMGNPWEIHGKPWETLGWTIGKSMGKWWKPWEIRQEHGLLISPRIPTWWFHGHLASWWQIDSQVWFFSEPIDS